MSFLEAYKRLDNLCKDLLGSEKGVTSYIDCMKFTENALYYVADWDEDYRKLKHLRFIRNKIAHDNFATEDNMSNDDDVKWIENFHQRIIERADPLALYHKAVTASKQRRKNTIKKAAEQTGLNEKKIPVWFKLLISACFIIVVVGIITLVYEFQK